MAKAQPRTIRGIRNALLRNVFIKSKTVRRAIDRNPYVRQATQLPQEYAEKFNEFVELINKAAEEEGADSRKKIRLGAEADSPVFEIRTAKRVVDTITRPGQKGQKYASFKQQTYFFNKLFPEIKESYELGHKNVSILRANMAIALDAFERNDPRRKSLLALYGIVQELDKVNEENINLVELIEKVNNYSVQERDFTVAVKRDLDTIKGLDYSIELEYEPIGLNQEKGRIAAKLGELFKSLVEEETKRVEEFLSGLNVEDFRGSPSFIEDLENLIADTIDPKRKAKKTRRGGSTKGRMQAGQKKKTTRKKLKTPVNPGKRAERKNVKEQNISPISLLTIINNKLPDTVAKNMVFPRLQYQTGRFANSVRAVDVQTTKQGFPSIGFTYQKFPYQTFEPGFAQGNSDRDPRKLIDASIREIATKLVVGRLYTRRV